MRFVSLPGLGDSQNHLMSAGYCIFLSAYLFLLIKTIGYGS